ncbi:SUF system Fe-S cluster assembly protein [Sphingomicrobium astaxanthinifaciens]|uniref:SUF system Fe-S cluster assembly protein n=1 Tax=Sphingomicrobium astaxanthinifaciens TaxID=1227949 RepID=UPI001FCBF7A1|nr:SUF system Fe-S cluster assembly protein [Sphingomicrobium astaxanthinifaciens]MCJ7421318.1 SUF system Fe-S cluster assembly protein [Sphingomicrobium astaxanthinifaciens]
MSDQRKIEIEEVDSVEKPPRARVGETPMQDEQPPESASEKLGRKRDYLEGFLSAAQAAPDSAEEVKAAIVEALQSIYDPEIPVDIYNLGLIYGVEVTEDGDATVTMTLTTPHCPVAETMPGEVEVRTLSVPGVRDAEVKLVWDPPWNPSKMSDEARLELGML